MPIPRGTEESELAQQAIYRKVTCEDGSVGLTVDFALRFGYALTVPTLERSEHGVVALGDDEQAFLSSSVPLQIVSHAAVASPTLEDGDTVWFVVRYEHEKPIQPTRYQRLLDELIDYWQEWAYQCTNLSQCVFGGPWHDLAVRLALLLKLLMHRETGAIATAPTTSLPEEIGGVRNWDYRFNWIRDAAFSVQALYKMGHVEEAREYFGLCLNRCHLDNPVDIQPLYGLHGKTDLDERILDHLTGYRESTPVRIGNAAEDQQQLDIYGEAITDYDWEVMRNIINYVCQVWQEPDAGIWEVRSEPQHFVYSKVMCWAALDRGIKIVEEMAFEAPLDRWRTCRDAIRNTVIKRGFSEAANSFVRSFGTENLDATSLLIPIVDFLPFDDPHVQGTIDATIDRLTTDSGLVYRYQGEDGLPGGEGTFVLCSFWLVDALALSGRLQEAKDLFETILEYARP